MFNDLGVAFRARAQALCGLLFFLWALTSQGCGRWGYDAVALPDETVTLLDGGAGDAAGFDAADNAPTNITLPYQQDFEALSATWTGKFIGSDAVAERDKGRQHDGDASLKCSKGAATGLRYVEVALAKALTTGEI